MTYRITLQQNLDPRPAAAFQVVYTFPAPVGVQVWPVTPIGPYQDSAVIVVNSPGHNLINQPGVMPRVLRGHYPTVPNTRDYAISSVQP